MRVCILFNSRIGHTLNDPETAFALPVIKIGFSANFISCLNDINTISFEDFSKAVEEYIDYYNNKRIQAKTKWMPPVQYRIASMCSA
ncbi:MAG: IS3 family transposase [Clostridia bacterium]|nr:IS3 family transposase [Clostridia bacterium]